MTRGDAAKLVTIMLATWKSQSSRIDPDDVDSMIEAWWKALEDMPSTVAAGALRRLQAKSKWIPTPADLRESADEIARGVKRAGGDAWGDVKKAIQKYGRHNPHGRLELHPGVDFDFDDPLVATAVDRLGWQELVDSENKTADRARFIELYDDLVAADRVEAMTMTLPGAAAPKRLGGVSAVGDIKQIAGAAQRALGEGTKGR